jgi:hypothetical protein
MFTFQLYSFFCVPLQHYRWTSEIWKTNNLCEDCFDDYKTTFRKFVENCSFSKSCKCNVCLCQALTLRNLTSLSVFHLSFNLSASILTGKTLFDQYVHATKSRLVPEYKLVPHTDLTLQCTFVRHKRCEFNRRFHDNVPLSEWFWSTFHMEHCASYEEVFAT